MLLVDCHGGQISSAGFAGLHQAFWSFALSIWFESFTGGGLLGCSTGFVGCLETMVEGLID